MCRRLRHAHSITCVSLLCLFACLSASVSESLTFFPSCLRLSFRFPIPRVYDYLFLELSFHACLAHFHQHFINTSLLCPIICRSPCVYLSLYQCIYVSVCVCMCLSVCVSVCACLCVGISVCLSVYVCLSLCLSVCISVCMYVCLSLFPAIIGYGS